MSQRFGNCDRVRVLVSASLDSELSEFEQAMMHAHLISCPSCAQHARHAAALTSMLRLAPLEPLPTPVCIPHRQRSSRRVVRAGAAFAAVVAAIGVGLSSTTLSRSGAVHPTSGAERGSLPAAYPTSNAGPSESDDRANWAGGLPRVTPVELPVPLGQRQVATDKDGGPFWSY